MISLENITKHYYIGKPNEFAALDGITLNIEKGEMLAIMGRSGAGKSTLVHIIGCLENATSGTYLLEGKNISSLSDSRLSKIRNSKIGILLQNFVLLQHQTALENCMVPLYFNPIPFSKMKKKALQTLERIGIADLSSQIVGTMSGGQQQRVALARAIVCDPQLIIADEPTGALDSHTADNVMAELKKLNETGVTVIIVTHDQSVADRCRWTIHINDGKLVETKSAAANTTKEAIEA